MGDRAHAVVTIPHQSEKRYIKPSPHTSWQLLSFTEIYILLQIVDILDELTLSLVLAI